VTIFIIQRHCIRKQSSMEPQTVCIFYTWTDSLEAVCTHLLPTNTGYTYSSTLCHLGMYVQSQTHMDLYCGLSQSYIFPSWQAKSLMLWKMKQSYHRQHFLYLTLLKKNTKSGHVVKLMKKMWVSPHNSWPD